MNILERFRRWRSSRGYGVHSPLAFRLVKNAVRPPRDVVYYGEEKLEVIAKADKTAYKRRKRARLLLRFVAEMQPAYVWTSPGLPEIYREAISLAGCVVRIFDGKIFPDKLFEADMAVIDGGKLSKKDLAGFLRPGKSLIGFGLADRFLRMVENSVRGGVIIDGENSVLAVATKDEALHFYKVSPF